MYRENAVKALSLLQVKGVGSKKVAAKYLEGKFDEFYSESGAQEFDAQIRRKLDVQVETLDCSVVAIGDENYPILRAQVVKNDLPPVLFYKGDLDLISTNYTNAAVIGVLDPEPLVASGEKKVVQKLVENGIVIVSGLAKGCDTIAHRATLDNGGKTVAVLPFEFSKSNSEKEGEILEEIVDCGGLLITEYYEAPKSRYDIINRLVHRDRLQALFSDVVILAGSYDKNTDGFDSGSRHALEKAKEYGINRAAIYGEGSNFTSSKQFDLNRKIIEEDGVDVAITPHNIESWISNFTEQTTLLHDSDNATNNYRAIQGELPINYL